MACIPAFVATSRGQVHALHAEALEIFGKSGGAPNTRELYGP